MSDKEKATCAKQEPLDNREWEISAQNLKKAHGYADGSENAKGAVEAAHKAEALAKDILRLSQNTLLINLRFMEAAFLRIVPNRNMDTPEIATDGQFLYYNALHVCRQFKRAKEIPVRDYLHTVLHCLFRHLFIGKGVDAQLWDLSCDIAVEHVISQLHLKSLYCERQASQAWLIRELEEKLPRLSAEWIYKQFTEEQLSPEEILHLQRHFHADDHSIWHNKIQLNQGSGDKDENDAGTPDGDTELETDQNAGLETEMPPQEEGESQAGSNDEMAVKAAAEDDGAGGAGNDADNEEDSHKEALSPEDLEQAWKEIAQRIQVDLDTVSDSYGEGAGDMQQALEEINRERYDYTELLRRFTVLGENIEVNDDEFDYIFYTYGMKLYENMPLIEPLEYKETQKIREFVIALDTSESVSGETVQKFVTKTWNILKQSENFFTRINVHIMQCGARVEEDVRISTQEEFDAYIDGMVLKGFGGTDFRPVFRRVDALIRQHEFQNLKGLIYFTDGYGSYPAAAPAYDAAFVFLDQGYPLPDVPPWAIKMILKEDEIEMF